MQKPCAFVWKQDCAFHINTPFALKNSEVFLDLSKEISTSRFIIYTYIKHEQLQ